MHKTLERQIQRYLSITDTTSPHLGKFLNAINAAYLGFDEDRKLMSRSLELSSKEFVEINEKLQESRNEIVKEKVKDDAILENTGDGLIVTDKEGKIILVNPSAESMVGMKDKNLLDREFSEAVVLINQKTEEKIEKANSPVTEALNKKAKISLDVLIKSARDRIVGMIVTPYIINDEVAGTVIALRDVTKEKEIDKAKSEFVSLASHQLRTPLSTIGWYTETLLSEELGPLTKKQKEYLTEAQTANKRMIRLVNALLNVSRIEMETLTVDPEDLDVTDTAEIVLKDLAPGIQRKKLKIVKNYEGGLPRAYTDQKLLQVLFLNLLSNAVRYTPEKGKIEVSIGLDPKNKNNFTIEISDTGFGIPEEEQDQIFQKLFRATNAREKSTDGTGLGLYLVKSIVDRIGGSVYFKSELNKGTTFFISMPIRSMPTKGTRKLS